jgi:preprotein translocase subunit YajC
MPVAVSYDTQARLARGSQLDIGTTLRVSVPPARGYRKVSEVQIAAPAQGGGGSSLFIVVGLLFVVMYFFMIRPQQRRRRQVETMQSNLGAGDEVVTVGGLFGTVQSVDDESVMLEIAPGVTARYARGAISKVITSVAEPDETTAEDETSANKVIDSD